ncbi:nucleotide exchange factor GrpE [Candidatus Microgenomates bacterium]|nr:nucleotide exchange factor GrpE [Candidatus Microgenomates bacterium]
MDDQNQNEEQVDEVVAEGAPVEKTELQHLEEERDEYKNKYLRALADYQNFQKRARDDRDQTAKQATKFVLLRMLPFLDNLEKAETFVSDEGLKMIKDQFVAVLEKEGLKEIDVLDKEYDPYTAEAIDIVAGKKDNIVVEVLEKGYEFQGDILRPAKVKVSKKVTN